LNIEIKILLTKTLPASKPHSTDIYPDKKNKIHPATKSFQAFRIYINNELTELSSSLIHAKEVIKKMELLWYYFISLTRR
jgi:16S rRNA C1402 N4-methylase RsmH